MFRTEIIKNIRISANKSQDEVAKLLEVSRSTYSMWETNHDIFPLKRLLLFCKIFDVSLDFVFDFSNEKYNILCLYDKDKSIKRLKEFRKENKLTQVKLAELLNTVHPVIVNYENGKHMIATPFLYDICKLYKISADYLLGRIDEPKYIK